MEEAAKTQGLSITYSEGKRPAPQISIAAPLPLGVTSDCELVDIFFDERVDLRDALQRISRGLPDGVRALEVEEVGITGPSLQSQLRWAEYEVEVPRRELTAADVQREIDRVLQVDSLPSEYRRESKVRSYDLRPLIFDLRLDGEREGCFILSMRLGAEPERTARADQVVLALGLPEPRRIHRRSLYLDETPAVVLAFRRASDREAD